MPAPMKPGLLCPECGKAVLLIFHEWSGSTDTARFEYHHTDDPRREHPMPCVAVLPYADGLERFKAECP